MEVTLNTTDEIKDMFSTMESITRFPLICYEKDETRICGKTPTEIMDEAKTMHYKGEWMLFRSVGVPIGLACVQIETGERNNLYLKEFEVAVDSQGHGYSTIMLDYVFTYAKAHSCGYVKLIAFDDTAYGFWKHQGLSPSPNSTDRLRRMFKKI